MVEIGLAIIISVGIICVTLGVCYGVHLANKNKRHMLDYRLEREIELSKLQSAYDIRKMELDYSKPKPVVVKDPEKKQPDKASENDVAAWYELLADPFQLFEGTKQTEKEVK